MARTLGIDLLAASGLSNDARNRFTDVEPLLRGMGHTLLPLAFSLAACLYLTHDFGLQAGIVGFGRLGTLVALPAVLPVAWRLIEVPNIALSRRVQKSCRGLEMRPTFAAFEAGVAAACPLGSAYVRVDCRLDDRLSALHAGPPAIG